jgi:hypothetical protein
MIKLSFPLGERGREAIKSTEEQKLSEEKFFEAFSCDKSFVYGKT